MQRNQPDNPCEVNRSTAGLPQPQRPAQAFVAECGPDDASFRLSRVSSFRSLRLDFIDLNIFVR